MPEGPSIVILKQEAGAFVGRHIVHASGNSKIDMSVLQHQRIMAMRTWGKQFLVVLPDRAIRIHLLMFGSYRINQRKDTAPRLSLEFARGELNFYACSVRYLEGDLDGHYDWRADVMSSAWDPKLALARLRKTPSVLICDALLDQNLFAGVGNIIKNEVLFRTRVHPLSKVGAIPPAKLREIVHEARAYSFEFLAWKRAFVLREHWLAHNRGICPRDHVKFKRAYLGRTNRRTFFCELCQKLYDH